MNKNQLVGVIAFIVLLGFVLGFWFTRQGAKESLSSATSIFPHPPIPSNPSATSPPSSPAPNQLSPAQAQKNSEAQVQYQNHVFEMLFLTPIVFYGKVVETDGTPIAGATVSISAADSMQDNHSKYERITDSAGLFSISTHGMGLVINVSKDGYYKTSQSGGSFGYSKMGGPTNEHPDPKNPAIFVLKKMGIAEPLIMIHRDVKILKNGTLVQMNLATGDTYNVAKGDIQVEAWTHDEGIPPNHNQPYDWRCTITVPGGGLQPRSGEFNFEAPTDGYQVNDVLDMPASATPWSKVISREYFLKLANGDYARVSFTMRAGGAHFFSITSYLNPQPGHRNLEYDPNQTTSK